MLAPNAVERTKRVPGSVSIVEPLLDEWNLGNVDEDVRERSVSGFPMEEQSSGYSSEQ